MQRLIAKSIYDNNCLLWCGYVDRIGYGIMSVNNRLMKVHRIAYAYYHGLDESLNILHSCDIRRCISEEHLSQGTHQDNMDDMVKKGRASRLLDARNGRAKLSYEIADDMRSRYTNGMTTAEIARLYSVGWNTVQNVILGKRWVRK